MSELSTALAGFFWSWIAPLAIQAALFLSFFLCLERFLPRRVWPELRLAVGTVLVLKLLLPPQLASPVAWVHPFALWADQLDAAQILAAAGPEAKAMAILVAWVWLAGVALVLFLEHARALQRRRSWQTAEEVPETIRAAAERAAATLARTAPSIRCRADVASPFVFGLLRPRVLLPVGIRPAVAEHVLLHEIAHLARFDLWFAAVTNLVVAAYWFHPLVWWSTRRLTALRELGCDKTVARRLGSNAPAYRRTLLELAAERYRGQLTGLAFTGGSSLLERLRALESEERDHPRWRRIATAAAAAAALLVAVPLAPAAERTANEVARLVARPPGCLQLRFLVLRQLAEEQRTRPQNPELP